MHWDWQQRRLQLSSGELARFDLLNVAQQTGSGLWRAQLGTEWHNKLRKNAEALNEGWLFETACQGTIGRDGWTFDISGRIDQLRPGPVQTVREIKTVHCSLPEDEDILRQRFPTYLLQLLVYMRLINLQGVECNGELLLVDIATGETQILPTRNDDQQFLDEHLYHVTAHLEARRQHTAKLRNLSVPDPFPDFREGQEEAALALEAAAEKSQVTLFEAPTGFGKTGLALHRALQFMAAGKVDRILLLSGKNTGQAAYLKQLESFRQHIPHLTAHVLRSREDLALPDWDESKVSQKDIIENWRASGLNQADLLADGPLSVERLKKLGLAHNIPPSAISRLLLPYADVWIADFNYLFDPVVSTVIENSITFDAERTFLVIDEAHNLPERVAACYSERFSSPEVDAALTELQFSRFPGKLSRILDIFLSQVAKLWPGKDLDPLLEADLISYLRDSAEAIKDSSFELEELSDTSMDLLWKCAAAVQAWDHPRLSMLLTIPARAIFAVTCIDASQAIATKLKAFPKAVLMSATLQPFQAFKSEIGLQASDSTAFVTGESSWLHDAYRVHVDARPDTRFKARQSSADLTAHTLAQTALRQNGPVAAFLPSYRYAELIGDRLAFLYPGLRTEMQSRQIALAEQQPYIEGALDRADILLLVLGGRFTEGIDVLGGRVRKAIVIGPALPEFNAVQRARESLHPNRNSAFESVYLIPGMRKVRQAIGRLVRTPQQQADILLHCQRFAEDTFLQHLPPYLQPDSFIRTNEDLEQIWLNSSD